MTNIKTKIITILSTITLVASLGILAGCSTGAGNVSAGNEGITNQQVSNIYPSKEAAIEALKNLKIENADQSKKMDRDKDFGSWKYDSKAKHNTRFEVLQKQGTNVKVEDNKIVSGEWYIPYTGETITCTSKDEVSKAFDIDHIVPVNYAYQHGAANWDQDKREEFANDLGEATGCTVGNNGVNNFEKHSNLIVSDAKSNRQKSDKGPSAWMPSNKNYTVEYAER